MDNELAEYAEAAIQAANRQKKGILPEDAASIISIEERMTSFSHVGARESMKFIENTFHEIRSHKPLHLSCGGDESDEILHEGDSEDENDSQEREFQRRMWLQRQQDRDNDNNQDWDDSLVIQDGDLLPSGSRPYPTENTSLL